MHAIQNVHGPCMATRDDVGESVVNVEGKHASWKGNPINLYILRSIGQAFLIDISPCQAKPANHRCSQSVGISDRIGLRDIIWNHNMHK